MTGGAKLLQKSLRRIIKEVEIRIRTKARIVVVSKEAKIVVVSKVEVHNKVVEGNVNSRVNNNKELGEDNPNKINQLNVPKDLLVSKIKDLVLNSSSNKLLHSLHGSINKVNSQEVVNSKDLSNQGKTLHNLLALEMELQLKCHRCS